MALATVGALLIGVVTVSSLASLRRRMSYETWYFVHLLAYVGFAASFGHQVVLGGDFAEDALARWFWIALHLAVLGLIVWRRWGTTVRSVLAPLRIVDIRRVADDAVALRLGGRGLSDIEALPGQFFFLRPLRKGWWWQAHPFSLSEAPWSSGLRFTIKARGDATTAIAQLRRGTVVAVEGPYGVCTPEVIEDRKVVFIVGGVGVAPVRAILERLTRANEPIVLYRAHRHQDLLHLDELRALAEARGGEVRTLVGPSATLAVKDPFSAKRLVAAVPDLATRVAVVCGPERLLWAARAGLRGAGVNDDDIHYEHPWW
jgi:predicted ferric reductase